MAESVRKLKNTSMILDDLLQGIVLLKTVGSTDMQIENIQFDSRKVEAGSLFVATKGTAADGHQYITTAIENGAVAIVCEDLPADLAPNITYIKVENSSDALGKMASAWYGFPS